jgi:hypothetical protein
MDDAGAVPQDHLAAGHFFEVLAEMPVGDEQDLLVLGDSPNHFLRVAGRDDPIGKRLHRRRTIDVRHRLEATAILAQDFLIALQLDRGAAFCEAATGLHIGQQHALVRVEHLGCFRHKVDATEHDGRRLHLRRGASELQAIAGEVGQLLNFAFLIVVREDGRVLLLLELTDFRGKIDHGRFLVFSVAQDNPQLRRSFT